MSENPQVSDLVARLRRLQLEQQEVLRALDQALQDDHRTSGDSSARPQPIRIAPEGRIGFVVGDSVFITNRIRHVPIRRTPSLRDRAAIITSMNGARIQLRTYNGYDTWRLISNIRHLTRQEKERIEAS